MKRAVRALLLCAVSMAPAHADFDRVALKVETVESGFAAAEEKYLALAATNEGAALVALAEFYMANELWVEALAAVKRVEARSPEGETLAAECDYRLGRDRAVIRRLGGGGESHPLIAMSLARLGAYADARAAFAKSKASDVSSGLRADYYLTRAEALAEAGDPSGAADALRQAPVESEASRRQFIAWRILKARGDQMRAGAMLRRTADGPATAWTMRARLALAAEKNDFSVIETLSLEWRGGAFDRALYMMQGRLALAEGDYRSGIGALRLVVDRFPESDDALAAQGEIGEALPRILTDAALGPKTAAEIFFENVEFAPPGREGDDLIHEAAEKLEALGLYAQAAQLLDHQVYKRLRGSERATVAADLGELHMTASNPKEALRVIRSTRIAGLPAPVNERRRQLEARALAAIGETERALALLSSSPTLGDLRLRADINWSRKAWPAAATDYASFVAATSSLNEPAAREAAVRGATAFLLAGDRAGYRSFALEAVARLDGTAEGDLISTLGDVDREQFLDRFMASYKSVYGTGKS